MCLSGDKTVRERERKWSKGWIDKIDRIGLESLCEKSAEPLCVDPCVQIEVSNFLSVHLVSLPCPDSFPDRRLVALIQAAWVKNGAAD